MAHSYHATLLLICPSARCKHSERAAHPWINLCHHTEGCMQQGTSFWPIITFFLEFLYILKNSAEANKATIRIQPLESVKAQCENGIKNETGVEVERSRK